MDTVAIAFRTQLEVLQGETKRILSCRGALLHLKEETHTRIHNLDCRVRIERTLL